MSWPEPCGTDIPCQDIRLKVTPMVVAKTDSERIVLNFFETFDSGD